MAMALSLCFCLSIMCNLNVIMGKTLIDKVHVVFSNHLDVGYHRGYDLVNCVWNGACFSHSVINQYWHLHWPLAIDISQRLQREFPNDIVNKSITSNYMTFPYLMSLYLDCDSFDNKMGLECPSKDAKQYVLNAIKNGHIWFNAFPFNSQLEDYDASLLEFGIKLSFDIMNQTGLPSKWHSTVISQRDVPGVPRNMIPVLVSNGIRAVSVGANDGNTPLFNDTISSIFKWRDPNSNEEMLLMYHSGGYGGFKIRDALIIDGYNQALIYAWNSDNLGPFKEIEILGIYAGLEEEFRAYNEDEHYPVEMVASSFDMFLDELYAFPNKSVLDNLPIYMGEIGDRWSFGIQSDPFKNAAYRNMMKLRTDCLKAGKCSLKSQAFYNFSRQLIKNGEHTWGASVKKALDGELNAEGYSAYYNEDVQRILASNDSVNNFTQMRLTWDEQRDLGITYPLEALLMSEDPNDMNLYQEIIDVIKGRLHNVSAPDLTEFKRVENTSKIFTFCDGRYMMQFNHSNGAIGMLYDKLKDRQYAKGVEGNNLGQFWYQALNQSLKGTKGNITLRNVYISTVLVGLYHSAEDVNKIVIEMNFGNEKMHEKLCANYSCIWRVYNELEFDCDGNMIEMNLNIINKTLTRIPETLYFSFVPYKCNNWTIASYGEDVMLNDILGRGSWNIYSYGIEGYVSCMFMNDGYKLNVESIDIGLTSWKPIKYEDSMAEGMYLWENGYFVNSSQSDGFAFEMVNNMWGTNYPQWYPFHPIDANITYNVILHL